MEKYFFIILVLFAGISTKQGAAQDSTLSVLVFNDSLIFYSGTLQMETPYTKIKADENAIRDALLSNKERFGQKLKIFIKVSNEAGVMEKAGYVKESATQMGFASIEVTDPGKNDSLLFNFKGMDWDFVKSLPHSSKLLTPKPGKAAYENDAVLTLILLHDSIVYYRFKDITNASKTSYTGSNSIRSVLQAEIKKASKKNISVAIKPTAEASYKNTIDALDEMTINNISKYSMVQLSEAEKSFFKVRDFSWEPAEPVEISSPTSVTSRLIENEFEFRIELRHDQTVWYQMVSPDKKTNFERVTEPITKNLTKVIAVYEKSQVDKKGTYLIVGDPNSKYAVFEQVINALRENNIYKYNLVTSEN